MIWNIKIFGVYIGLSVFLAHSLIGQTPAEIHSKYLKTYPDENGVITEMRQVVYIRRSGDSLAIHAENYEEILVLNKPSKWVKDKIYSSSFSQVENLEAYTLLPGKKKYKKVAVEDFKKSYDKNTYIFYDDTEVINFNYPQLVEGARIVNSYEQKIIKPHLIGKYFFSSYIPTLSSSYEIIVEDGVEISHGLINASDGLVKFQKEKLKDGSTKYSFHAIDVPKIDYKENSLSFSYLAPTVYFTIKSFENSKGEIVPVLSSLDDLHTWYKTFLENLEINDSLKEITAEIVDPMDSPLEKTRKIFYWVQKNVKYIAFEDGMRGFIPHDPKYVYDKRYGDCKDMASLLIGLLRTEGIDANYTWIGTRDLPYRYSELPSPLVDNHMIATATIEGEKYFLDATGSYVPLGYPTPMIQGKESLISRGDNYEVAEVPVVEKERNTAIDTSFVQIANGIVRGKGKLVLTGLLKVSSTYSLIQRNDRSEERTLKYMLGKASNKFILDSYEVKNVDDLDAPIEISYDFNIEDYYSHVGEEIFLNLNMDNSLVNTVIKDRTTPRESDYKWMSRSVYVFDIPDDYKLTYVPEDTNSEFDKLGFRLEYRVEANRVIALKEIYWDHLVLYPSEFDAWNDVIKDYSQATRKTIVLEKK